MFYIVHVPGRCVPVMVFQARNSIKSTLINNFTDQNDYGFLSCEHVVHVSIWTCIGFQVPVEFTKWLL